MLKRNIDVASGEIFSTVDETAPENTNLCPANIGTLVYVSCGKKMRRLRNGVTVCPDHGEMH